MNYFLGGLAQHRCRTCSADKTGRSSKFCHYFLPLASSPSISARPNNLLNRASAKPAEADEITPVAPAVAKLDKSMRPKERLKTLRGYLPSRTTLKTPKKPMRLTVGRSQEFLWIVAQIYESVKRDKMEMKAESKKNIEHKVAAGSVGEQQQPVVDSFNPDALPLPGPTTSQVRYSFHTCFTLSLLFMKLIRCKFVLPVYYGTFSTFKFFGSAF